MSTPGCPGRSCSGGDEVRNLSAAGDRHVIPTLAVRHRRMALMALYRDAAIVLRAQKLGEADRIVTLLTRQRGKVRAVAKGVRRTKSRFGARLEPFMVVDVQLYEGRSLDTVTQAETLAPYGDPIARDYVAY